MFIHKRLFEHILADNKEQQLSLDIAHIGLAKATAETQILREQKVKDDLQLDWLRHRVNALEKERQILLQRVAGIVVPVPELSVTPNVVSTPAYEIPSFDDMGDDAAKQAGIFHDDSGEIVTTQV